MSNKLVICSYFFTFTILISLLISEFFSKKVALNSALYCLLLNIVLYGTVFKWVHAFSFLGLLCAIYVSIHHFSFLKTRYALPISFLLTLLSSIGVDALVMLPWELSTFSGDRLLNVISRSLLYKCSYAALISFCVLLFDVLKSSLPVLRTLTEKLEESSEACKTQGIKTPF